MFYTCYTVLIKDYLSFSLVRIWFGHLCSAIEKLVWDPLEFVMSKSEMLVGHMISLNELFKGEKQGRRFKYGSNYSDKVYIYKEFSCEATM